MNSLGWMFHAFTCTSVLTSCGSAEAFQLGRQVHAYTIKANLVESDEFVKTALIDMYCKCDYLVDARKVLHNMIDFSVVSHNAMIEGYSRNQQLFDVKIAAAIAEETNIPFVRAEKRVRSTWLHMMLLLKPVELLIL
ncbi:hypothetical protein Dimus_025066 [Dionaea muscipula]